MTLNTLKNLLRRLWRRRLLLPFGPETVKISQIWLIFTVSGPTVEYKNYTQGQRHRLSIG